MTFVNCHLWHLIGRLSQIVLSRESHPCQLNSISSNIHPRAKTDMYPYDGIWRGFLGIQSRWCLFAAGMLMILGATGWTPCPRWGDQRIQHVFKPRGGSIDVSYPHVAIDCIWLSDSPNWVWQVYDSLNELIRTHGGSGSGRIVRWRITADLQSIRLLALQPQGKRKRWQRTGQAIRYAPGMYRDHS